MAAAPSSWPLMGVAVSRLAWQKRVTSFVSSPLARVLPTTAVTAPVFESRLGSAQRVPPPRSALPEVGSERLPSVIQLPSALQRIGVRATDFLGGGAVI